MSVKLQVVAQMKMPKHSAKAVANGIRAFIRTYLPVTKPIAYIVQEGETTAHLDGVSEELFSINSSLAALEYNVPLALGQSTVINAEFSGIVTYKNIHKFLPMVVVSEDLKNSDGVIMTIVEGKIVKLGIILMSFSGLRNAKENYQYLEEYGNLKADIGKIKPFSSLHRETLDVVFEEVDADLYFSTIEFRASSIPKFQAGMAYYNTITANYTGISQENLIT